MQLDIRKEDSIVVVTPLEKDINAFVSKTFKESVIDLIEQGNLQVLINLKNIEFVDSCGIGVFIAFLKLLQRNQGLLALCEMKKPVTNIFQLTRVDKVIKIYNTESEALEALRGCSEKTAKP